MGASDLQVTVVAPKLRCVLEPVLALAHPLGARVALALARAFELWLTRSFWRSVDASDLLLRQARPAVAAGACLPDERALADWLALRNGTDAGSWFMRWVGDCVAESQLHAPAGGDVVERYEWLASSLEPPVDAAAAAWWRSLDLRSGGADCLALSAALDGAMILCLLPDGGEPAPVQRCRGLGVPVSALRDDDDRSLLATERQVVRHALAGAGLAALLQSWPPLAVVHALPDTVVRDDDGEAANPWHGASACWYRI